MRLIEFQVGLSSSLEQIHTLPQDQIKEISNVHLLMKWDTQKNNELMFQLKGLLKKKDTILYPIELKQIDKKILDKIDAQIEQGHETRLYLTNGECVHVWKVCGLLKNNKNLKKYKGKIHQDFEGKSNTWLVLEDLYVLSATHLSVETQDISLLDFNHLDKFNHTQVLNAGKVFAVIDPSHQCIFSQVSYDRLEKNVPKTQKWIETGRSLTFDYYQKSSYLKASIYNQSWDSFEKTTQHFLVEFLNLKMKSSNYKMQERLKLLGECFELYSSAVFSQLRPILIQPLIEIIEATPVLFQLVTERSTEFKFFNSKDVMIWSYSEFCEFILEAKSMIFTLRRKLEKDIGCSSSIKADHLLLKHEKVIEKVLRFNLIEKLDELSKLKNWFTHLFENIEQIEDSQIMESIFMANTILSRLASSNKEENFHLNFYHLLHGNRLKEKPLSIMFDELSTNMNNVVKKRVA